MFSWNRWLKQASGRQHKQPVKKSKRAPHASLRLEQMEDRIVPAGKNIAVFVAGFGGQGTEYIPDDVHSYLSGRGFTIKYASWNAFDVELGEDRGDPGSAAPVGFSGTTIGPWKLDGVGSIGPFTVPQFLTFEIDIGNPNTRDNFLTDAKKYLAQFDNDDNIVLIGHSMGGGAILELARQVNVQIDFLGLLDPAGFSDSLPPNSDDFILASLPGGYGTLFGLSAPRGLQNDDGKVPGFRNSAPFGGGLPSAPSNVYYLYNRWQTNVLFPVDYGTSGSISSNAQFSNQAAQNTGAEFGLNDIAGNPALAIAYVFGAYDNEIYTYFNPDDEIRIPEGFNSHYLRSNAQLHHNFPTNATINSEMVSILDSILPRVVNGTSNNDTFEISAGDNSGEVRVKLNGEDQGSLKVNRGQIQINGLGGNDTITVDLEGGTLQGQTLLFNGGSGTDTLVTENGSFTDGTVTSVGARSGRVKYDSVTISYTETERANLTAPTNDMVYLATTESDTISIENGPTINPRTRIRHSAKISDVLTQFVTTDFAYTKRLEVRGLAGNDQIDVLLIRRYAKLSTMARRERQF